MEAAIEALLAVYADTRAQRPAARGEAVLASIMLDKEGRLAGDNPVALSSFGWAVPVALAGDLRSLESWPRVERDLVDGLMAQLRTQDEDGTPLPLTAETIAAAFSWLTTTLGLAPGMVKPPCFTLCTYQWNFVPDAPDPVLLNSFYLKDLALAKKLVREGGLTENLKQYLGTTLPEKRWNLMENQAAVRQALAPGSFPSGSWPGKGRHSLVLLQQCAVNNALSGLKGDGILGINGPPGTGKTTLLRDMVAGIVTERAKVMATYDDPEDAFPFSGFKMKRYKTPYTLSWQKLFRADYF